MTWAEFKAELAKHLDVDATRRGTATFLDASIKAAVRDLGVYLEPIKDYLAEAGFSDNEDTPLDERVAECAAEFVKARFARNVERDLNLYQAYQQAYLEKRRTLYVDWSPSTECNFVVNVGDTLPVVVRLLSDGNGLMLDDLTGFTFEVLVQIGDKEATSKSTAEADIEVRGLSVYWTWSNHDLGHFPRTTPYRLVATDQGGVRTTIRTGTINIR